MALTTKVRKNSMRPAAMYAPARISLPNSEAARAIAVAKVVPPSKSEAEVNQRGDNHVQSHGLTQCTAQTQHGACDVAGHTEWQNGHADNFPPGRAECQSGLDLARRASGQRPHVR